MATLDYDQVYQLAIQQGATADEAGFLASVAGPESGYRTEAHNPNASTGDNSFGLLQINMLGKMGENRQRAWGLNSYDDLYDPATNIRAGLEILRSQGKHAWTTYTSGKAGRYQPGDVSAAQAGAGGAGAALGMQIVSQQSTGQGLMKALGSVSGQTYAGMTSAHGDTLGDRLDSILNIIGGKAPTNG